MDENHRDYRYFPWHVCVLAREANPNRCDRVQDSNPERCEACRNIMQNLMWEALYTGDRSLAIFLLPEHIEKTGVGVEFYESGDRLPLATVLNLILKLKRGVDSCTMHVIPDPDGSFRIYDGGDEDEDVVEQSFERIGQAYEFFLASLALREVEGYKRLQN